MVRKGRRLLCAGVLLIVLFVIWTVLIQVIDVRPAGETGTAIGFASFNCWFHELTGVHMTIYHLTDWLGLVPVFVCLLFCGIGVVQVITRKSLFKVDSDIILLGIYYVIVIICYLVFELIPINYRPILIDGAREASYPSSTTLLVLSVMPTLVFQVDRRVDNTKVKNMIAVPACLFSLFMVLGRIVAGVHWFTDIAGSLLLSGGLFCMYKAFVLLCCKGEK